MMAGGKAHCAHLERSNLVQHHCLELLIADVPVAQHLMDLSAQLVDIAVTAAAAAADSQSIMFICSLIGCTATWPPDLHLS
jgi:hypothetical protein